MSVGFQLLCELIESPGPKAFLVGAGISFPGPSYLPTAAILMSEILEQLRGSVQPANIGLSQNWRDALLTRLRFEMLVQISYMHVDRELAILGIFAEDSPPNPNHFVLASLLLKGCPVLTTNFDHLIEAATPDGPGSLDVLIDDNEYRQALNEFRGGNISGGTRIQRPAMLAKLHGTLRRFGKRALDSQDARKSIVATLEGIFRAGWESSGAPHKAQYLRHLLRSCDLFVMGYSGGDAFDISPVLMNTPSIRNLVWIKHESDGEYAYLGHDAWDLARGRDVRIPPSLGVLLHQAAQARGRGRVCLLGMDTLRAVKEIAKAYGVAVPAGGDSDRMKVEARTKEFVSRWSNSIAWKAGQRILVLGDICLKAELAPEAISCLKSITGGQGIGAADVEVESLAHHYLGMVYRQTAENDQALTHFMRSVEIDRELHDSLADDEGSRPRRIALRRVMAFSMGEIASILWRRKRIDEARTIYHEIIPLGEAVGDLKEIGVTYTNLGNIELEYGSEDQALRYFAKAVEILRQQNDPEGLADALHELGVLWRRRGNFSEAERRLEEARRIFEMAGIRSGIASVCNTLGLIRMRQHRLLDAKAYLKESMKIRKRELGDLFGFARSADGFAEVLEREGRPEAAYRLITYALTQMARLSEAETLELRAAVTVRRMILAWKVKGIGNPSEIMEEIVRMIGAIASRDLRAKITRICGGILMSYGLVREASSLPRRLAPSKS